MLFPRISRSSLLVSALSTMLMCSVFYIYRLPQAPIIINQHPAALSFQRDLHANLQHKVLRSQTGLELYVHKAFIDDRFNHTVLRIFALEMKEAVNVDFVCRWKELLGSDYRTIEVAANKYLIDKSWPDWSPYFASNYDCVMPAHAVPVSVQLASRDGLYSFQIPVEGQARDDDEKTTRFELGVCVKPITGDFKVARFIEWIEIQRLAGINHFIIYITDLRGAARFVFRYYERLGLVSVVEFPYLTAALQKIDRHGYTSSQRYGIYQQIYLVAMHDCLYRFRRYFKNLAFIDVDEVILPQLNETLPATIQRLEHKHLDAAGYMFLTAWHFEEFSPDMPTEQPDYVYMLQYSSSTPPIDNQPKSVMITDRVITINFHSVLDVPDTRLSNKIVAWEEFGYVHHYRGKCIDKFENWQCERMRKTARQDHVISRYEVALKVRVTAVLDHLQIV